MLQTLIDASTKHAALTLKQEVLDHVEHQRLGTPERNSNPYHIDHSLSTRPPSNTITPARHSAIGLSHKPPNQENLPDIPPTVPENPENKTTQNESTEEMQDDDEVNETKRH